MAVRAGQRRTEKTNGQKNILAPESLPLQRGCRSSQRSARNFVGGFLFSFHPEPNPHTRDLSQAHLAGRKPASTSCIDSCSSERRQQLGQRPTPDDPDLHPAHAEKNPPNAIRIHRDGSVRRARLSSCLKKNSAGSLRRCREQRRTTGRRQ